MVMIRLNKSIGKANRVKTWALLLAALTSVCSCPWVDAAPTMKPTKPPSVLGQADAMVFLQKYGYLAGGAANPKCKDKCSAGLLQSEETFREALKEYQAFSGLPVTGELDEATQALMRIPRCGVKDIDPKNGRRKRYALHPYKWETDTLTYRVSKYPPKLFPSEVDTEIRRALELWSKNAALRFAEAPEGQEADIDIRFEEGHHSDCDPFDGRGGVLGHAYYPIFGGDAHFDADELWTIDSYRGTNLFQVAAHEFGHSLGLYHSDEPDSVMAPVSRFYDPDYQLHEDDIQGIQALYGEPMSSLRIMEEDDDDKIINPVVDDSPGSPPIALLPTSPPNSLCADAKVDTMFKSAEGHVYAFKGEQYYQLNANGIESGYPKLISEGWPGLPGDIDAAFTYRNGRTYFFKGENYWRYEGRKMDGDYPKLISDSFPFIPSDVDAAMMWPGNGKVYFFKGDEFWKYDPAKTPAVDISYPRPIALWDGVPDNLDAVLVYEGYTYFFKDNKYYRFDDYAFTVDTGNPGFPRPTARWWFGCGRPEPAEEIKRNTAEGVTQDLADK